MVCLRRFALLLVLTLVAPRPARGADPSLRWRTITTPHFYVHYYISSRHSEAGVARRVARAAEAAHAKLTKALGHVPSSRTHVVVTDDTDGANGSAQAVPMNIIRLFVTGPSSISALNDYDDWLYGLILHEYTHILHLDTIHGVARVVNAVLGKTWAPNQIQPRWIVEGLAVYFETERSSGGRNRSSIYDMYLRSAVLEGKLLQMDQITSGTRSFPRGTVPYLYGSRFIKYIADRFGEEKLKQISHAYGGSAVPYGINRVARRVLGKTFVELYADFRQYLRQRYELQRALVRRRGETAFRKITDYGESCGSPRFSADGRELVFVDTDGRSQSAVKVLDVQSGRIKEQFDVFGSGGVGFTPDGQHLVYSQSNIWKTFYSYHDIYVRHRASGRVRQLTRGLRARDPAVSPDGAQVAFVTSDLGTMNLALIPFDGGEQRVLLRGRRGDQIFAPRWSPDGQQLVYSRWRLGGDRDIYLFDLRSGTERRLLADRALDLDPVFSRDGKRIYFSSDRTGIFNIYSLSLRSGALQQVSNVLGGAFLPAVAPNEQQAYYVGFSAKGFDLHAMDLRRTAYLPALPYVNDRPLPRTPSFLPPRVAAAQEMALRSATDGGHDGAVGRSGTHAPGAAAGAEVASESKTEAAALESTPPESYVDRPYTPWRTVYPRAWSFDLGTNSQGTTLGLELDGGDVVGRHRYAAVGRVNTSEGHPSYSLAYSYNRFWPGITLDTSRYEGPRGGVMLDGVKQTYIEQNYGLGTGLRLPVLRVPDHAGDISIGYRVNWFRDADEREVLVTPGMLSPRLPEEGVLAGLTLGMNYRSLRRYAHSISTERGRMLSVALRVDHPSLASDYASTQLTYAWTEFVDLPWADDHVLALRLGGGISSGNLSRRGVFFVGGFPEQDVLRALMDSTRVGGVYLRGYPPGVVHGTQYHLLNVEYRMPLLEIERGVSSLPLYLTHVHLTTFADYGNAFFGEPKLGDFRLGVGAEVLFEMVIGYYLPTTVRVGYARGLMADGGNEFHFLLGNPF